MTADKLRGLVEEVKKDIGEACDRADSEVATLFDELEEGLESLFDRVRERTSEIAYSIKYDLAKEARLRKEEADLLALLEFAAPIPGKWEFDGDRPSKVLAQYSASGKSRDLLLTLEPGAFITDKGTLHNGDLIIPGVTSVILNGKVLYGAGRNPGWMGTVSIPAAKEPSAHIVGRVKCMDKTATYLREVSARDWVWDADGIMDREPYGLSTRIDHGGYITLWKNGVPSILPANSVGRIELAYAGLLVSDNSCSDCAESDDGSCLYCDQYYKDEVAAEAAAEAAIENSSVDGCYKCAGGLPCEVCNDDMSARNAFWSNEGEFEIDGEDEDEDDLKGLMDAISEFLGLMGDL